MENSSQADSLGKGSLGGGFRHGQSLETQLTTQVPGQDPKIKENLLENRYKVMQEIAIQSQASGSEFKLSQTNAAPDLRIDQWQVGPHGEIIGQGESGDDGNSMKTSEIESSAKSSSSEIPQVQSQPLIKRAGTIAVTKLEPILDPSPSAHVISPKNRNSQQSFLKVKETQKISQPEIESAYHGKRKEIPRSLEAGKASMRGSEVGSQYSQLLQDKRGSNAYNDSVDSQEKFKKVWQKSSLGSGLSERLSFQQNDNVSSQKNYPQKIIVFEQQDSEQNGFSQGPANLIQGHHQASQESNEEYQNTKQMVQFFQECHNAGGGSQLSQSDQLMPSDSIGGPKQFLQPRMGQQESDNQYNQMTFQNLNDSKQEVAPSGESLMGSISSSQRLPAYQGSIRSSLGDNPKISDSIVYQNSSIEFIDQSNQNIFKYNEEKKLIEDLDQLDQKKEVKVFDQPSEAYMRQVYMQHQMYAQQQQYLIQQQQQYQENEEFKQPEQPLRIAPLDQNYRNYSVLSKVVKNTGQHSRAIEQSLRMMQEAQKTIQQTLNTSDTARTAGLFSNRVMNINVGHNTIASPTASQQLYSQEMELGIVSGERQIIQVPSFTNLQAITMDTNSQHLISIENNGFAHLRRRGPSRELSPYQNPNESLNTITGKIPNRIHESRSRSREPLRSNSQDSPTMHRRSQSSNDLSYSRSAYKRIDVQNSGMALLKKTSALIKNPPAVSSYKSNSNLKRSSISQDDFDDSLLESSAKKRPKSSQNRRYCIGKLFKKATGVDLQQYKKAQEYRTTTRSNSAEAIKASVKLPQTHSLRIKSRSRTRSNSIRDQAETYRHNLNIINEEQQQQQLISVVSSPEPQKLDRATKINRYKKIEKELEVDRQIEQERQWIKEREEWEAEQQRQEILRLEREKKALEDQERLQRWHAERQKQAMIEEIRRREFVEETMRMMKKFEEEHPQAVEQQMYDEEQKMYEEQQMMEQRQMSSGQIEVNTPLYQQSSAQLINNNYQQQSPNNNINSYQQSSGQINPIYQQSSAYLEVNNYPYPRQMEQKKPPLPPQQHPIQIYEQTHNDEPRILSNGRRQQEQFESDYMNRKYTAVNSKIMSNIESKRDHLNSSFTLGGDPNINSHQSLQSSQVMRNNSGYREQQRMYSPTPDFQIYDNRYDYNRQSSRPIIQLQNVVEEPMAAPAPMYYNRQDEEPMAAPAPQYYRHLEEQMPAQAPIYYNIGQGLKPNESLLGMFRENEMPSMIHMENNVSASRNSLRGESPPQDYVSRNQHIRSVYEEHGERSRSRPDTFPCKGPSSRSFQREERQTREYSPSITGLDLRSNFGQRQKQQEEQEFFRSDDSFNQRQSEHPPVRVNSYDHHARFPTEYQVYNVQVPDIKQQESSWNIEGIDYQVQRSKSIDLKKMKQVSEAQSEINVATQKVNKQINMMPNNKVHARDFMNEKIDKKFEVQKFQTQPDHNSVIDLGKNYHPRVQDIDEKSQTQSQSTVAHSTKLSKTQQPSEIEKKKKSKKKNREEDFKRLMDLQVKQAQMLMDLQKQYFQTQDKDLESSRQVSESNYLKQSKQSLVVKNGLVTHRSQQSENQKNTMDLIQTIYRQMEKINQQIAQKQMIEEERFVHLDKKMRKLQKKYEKVKKLNQVDMQFQSQTSPRTKTEGITDRKSQTTISQDNLMNQSQDHQQSRNNVKHINPSSSLSSYQTSTNQVGHSLSQINSQLQQFEKGASLAQINTKLKQFETATNPYNPNDFNNQYPSIRTSSQQESFGAQYPSMPSITQGTQQEPPKEPKSTKNSTQQSPLEKVQYKLHTIQSVAHENDQSSRFNNVMSEQINSIEQLMQNNNEQVFSENQKSELEKQVQVMNQQVIQLREEQKQQIEQMKTFYEDQIKNMKVSSEDMAKMVLQKILESNTQVNQKDKLEKRLQRIKDKLQVAKNIKKQPPIKNQSTIQTIFIEDNDSSNKSPAFKQSIINKEIVESQPSLPSMGDDQSYSQFTSQTHLDHKVVVVDLPLSKNYSQNYNSEITQKTQVADQQPIRDQKPLDQSQISMIQSSMTLKGQASQRIFETDQDIYGSNGAALQSQAAISSQDEFVKQLNYQYLSKDLKKNGSSKTLLVVSKSEVQDRFLQPYRPNQSNYNEGSINDIYLRDTTQSMIQFDLNSESRQKIMLDDKKGINQKILDLQSLNSKKEQEQSAYSLVEQSEKSSNNKFTQLYNPSESNRTVQIGTKKIDDHIKNIRNIQKSLHQAPMPIRQVQTAYNSGRTESQTMRPIGADQQYNIPTESSCWSNTDRNNVNPIQSSHYQLKGTSVISSSNPASTRQVGLSSKFSLPKSKPFEMQAENIQVISHCPSEQSQQFQFTGYASGLGDTRDKFETKDHRDYTFKKNVLNQTKY